MIVKSRIQALWGRHLIHWASRCLVHISALLLTQFATNAPLGGTGDRKSACMLATSLRNLDGVLSSWFWCGLAVTGNWGINHQVDNFYSLIKLKLRIEVFC